MKNRKLTSLIAITAMFPIAAWSQTGTTGTTGGAGTSPGATGTAGAGGAAQHERGTTGVTGTGTTGTTRATGTAGQAGQDWQHTGAHASAAAQDIKRVSQNYLDNRLTADRLIGTEVVDRTGERIGTVRDIGLNRVLPQEFQSGAHAQTGSGMTGTAGATGRTGAAGTTGTSPGIAGTSTGTAAGTASGSTGMTGMTGQQSGQQDLNLYVAVGGFLGFGGDLVAIPASKLQYDQANEQLRLDATQDEIRAIARADDGGFTDTAPAE